MKVIALDQTIVGRAIMLYGVCLLVAALPLAPVSAYTGVGIASIAVALVYLAGATALVFERLAARWLLALGAGAHLAIAIVWAGHIGLLPAW